MHDHAADILGNEHLNTRPSPSHFTPQWLAVYAVVLVLLVAGARSVWTRVLLWRERTSRLAMRRRHGIPDSDMRPFNVAYAAVKASQPEAEKKRTRPKPSRATVIPATREAQLQQNLRLRAGISPKPEGPTTYAVNRATAHQDPAPYANVAGNSTQVYTQDYTPRHPGQFEPAPTVGKGLSRNPGYRNVQEANATAEDSRKRALDDDMELDDAHEAKKSRVHGVALEPTEDASTVQRGAKRGFGEDSSEEHIASRDARGKRARQGLQEDLDRQVGDESMEVDGDLEAEEAGDEITELTSPVRGKKRDRAAAGSTFGGDDDDYEQMLEVVEDGNDSRRRRKRRTVAKRKSEASFARGKKRDAEDDEDVSEEDAVSSPERRRRRNKRQTLRNSRSVNSDISMADSTRSRVREIGEEWESGGIKYKVGPNNDRLRQALVKKARQKFVMPQDSQHPDRDTNLEVYVECWLTEEEYAEAKKQHRLAWQDTPSKETPEKLSLNTTAAQPPQFHLPKGKSLLWSGPNSAASTPVASPASSVEPPDHFRMGRSRDSYRQSIATMPLSPFTVPSALPTSRRIVSSSQATFGMHPAPRQQPRSPPANGVASSDPGSPAVGDNTPASPSPRFRTYSKLEKQELEANAIMRVRAANAKKEEEARRAREDQERTLRDRLEKEKAEKEQREKAEKEKKEKEAAAASAPASTTAAPASSGFSFAPAAASAAPPKNLFAVDPKPTAATPAPAASATAEAPKFSFGPTAGAPPAAAPKPTNTFSFANAAPLGSGTAAAATPAAEAPKEASSGEAPSLLSRLAPQAGAEAPKPEAAKPATTGFSFGAPKVENAASPFAKAAGNPFGTAPANPTPAAPPAAAAAAAPAPSKFSFAFGATKPAGDAPKPAGSAFAFKVPDAPASASASASATAGAGTTQPKFSFNTANTSAPSAFGAAAPSATTAAPAAPTEAPKDAAAPTTTAPKFSFGAATGNPSVFGNTSNNLFGTNAASTTPAAAAAPAAEPAKDTAAPAKPVFSFGAATTAPATSAFPPANTSGTPAATTTNAAPANAFAPATNPNPFGASNTGAGVFGKPAGGAPTSAFGNAANGSNTGGSVFGATTNAGASNVFGAKSAFGTAPAATSVFGAAPAAATSAFGTAPAAATSVFGTAPAAATSAFGAAPAAATSAFGAAPAAATPAAPAAASADKPAEAPKPLFSFNTAVAGTSGAGSKPGFSFGSTATPAAAGSKPGFSFGAASTTPAAGTGAAPASSGFGFNFGGAAPAAGGASDTTSSGLPKPQPFGAAAPAATNPFGAPSTGGFSFGNTSK